MIDSTPTASGAVVDQRSARSPEPVVEADAGRQAEEAGQDALAQAGHGARPVPLEREQVLAGPEDRLDALADGGQLRAAAGFVLARRPDDRGAQLEHGGAELLAPAASDAEVFVDYGSGHGRPSSLVASVMVSVLPGPGRRPRWRHTPRRSLTARGPPAAARTCAAAERRLELLARCQRAGGETLLCDKGYAGREFAAAMAELGATVVRPARKDEPGQGPHLALIRQRIESIFWTCKDLLTLERHGARTMAGLRERILARFLCLAACISLNHRLGRPSRALVDYCA